MTQAEFNELPFLLDRRRVKEASGLTDDDIDQLRASKVLRTFRFERPRRRVNKRTGKLPRKHKYKSKYYKIDVARICGFEL